IGNPRETAVPPAAAKRSWYRLAGVPGQRVPPFGAGGRPFIVLRHPRRRAVARGWLAVRRLHAGAGGALRGEMQREKRGRRDRLAVAIGGRELRSAGDRERCAVEEPGRFRGEDA